MKTTDLLLARKDGLAVSTSMMQKLSSVGAVARRKVEIGNAHRARDARKPRGERSMQLWVDDDG